MRRVSVIILCCALLLSVFARPSYSAEGNYVKIKKPFVNIYEYLDPQSKIIRQAKKGDLYELVYEGTSWYQIKIQEKVGWLEKRAATVVKDSGVTILSIPIGTFAFFLIFLILTFTIVSIFIYRQKTAEL